MLFHSQFCCWSEGRLLSFLSGFTARHRVTEDSPRLLDTNLETPSLTGCTASAYLLTRVTADKGDKRLAECEQNKH